MSPVFMSVFIYRRCEDVPCVYVSVHLQEVCGCPLCLCQCSSTGGVRMSPVFMSVFIYRRCEDVPCVYVSVHLQEV